MFSYSHSADRGITLGTQWQATPYCVLLLESLDRPCTGIRQQELVIKPIIVIVKNPVLPANCTRLRSTPYSQLGVVPENFELKICLWIGTIN